MKQQTAQWAVCCLSTSQTCNIPHGGIYSLGMNTNLKNKVQNRLNRIEGQIRGVKRMVEEEKYCVDIITQAQAIKSALSAFEALMLENHLETHVAHQMRHGKGEKAVKEILKIYNVSQKKK